MAIHADTTEDTFLKALQGEDQLGMVIRAHIYIEHHLNEFLQVLIPYPEFLEPLKLDYYGRVQLAGAMGLQPQLLKPLQAVGALRNEMAHKLGTKLTKSRLRESKKCRQGCIRVSPGFKSCS